MKRLSEAWGGVAMENAVLLSPTDINTIRRYVHTKYAPLPGNRRAEIVADAIRRTLQQRLPNIPDDMKNQMIDKLITRCVLGEQREIKPDDVLDLCAEIEMDERVIKEQILEPILKWVNERSPGRWSADQIASRLDRRTGYSLAGILELPVNNDRRASWQGLVNKSMEQARGFLRRCGTPIRAVSIGTIVVIAALSITLFAGKPNSLSDAGLADKPPVAVKAPESLPDTGMPDRLKFAEINANDLKAYLKSRDSLLADEPYFGAIVDTARKYDIHPLLLFAITGQEQGFVPKSGKDAKTIANNPFNVGHSWMEYNTDIRNSVGIASRLLVKLAASRPEGHDPFEWFNKTYAEDPLWSDGVRKIFDKLNSIQTMPSAKAE